MNLLFAEWTSLAIARAQQCKEDPKRAKQKADDKRQAPLSLLAADHRGSNTTE